MKERRKQTAAEMREDGEKDFQGKKEEEKPLPEIFIPSIPCDRESIDFTLSQGSSRLFWEGMILVFYIIVSSPHMTKVVISQKRKMNLLIFIFLKIQRIIPSKLSLSALTKI